jgi:hypothetical protein
MASNATVFQATHDGTRRLLDIRPASMFAHDFEQYRTIQIVLIGAQTKQTTKLSKKNFF